MRRPPAFPLLAACLALAASSAPAELPLDSLLAAPFPSGLVAAPEGGRIAWVLDEGGARNVWLAEPPGYAARRLTAWTADDGQVIDSLGFTSDAVVFVRGGAPNRAGEVPNPTSAAAGAERAIWSVPLAGGEPRRIGEGHSPAVRPGHPELAFLQAGAIHRIASGAGAEPAQLAKPRGGVSSLRWSPDGSRLAFASDRGDHGFVGVVDVEAGSVSYLDPSLDSDGSPAWSPDGTSIAFVRQALDPTAFPFRPQREGPPWSIRVVELASGSARELFRARPGRGSVFQGLAGADDLFWSADGHVVFPWEAEGWLQLWSVPAAGGTPRRLTPGAFEVEHAAPGADGRSVVFSSNQDDVDRRHVWRVAAAGAAAPAPLSTGRGIEWGPVETSGGEAVALLRSDARRPARAALLPRGGALRDLAPDTLADFPAGERLVEPEAVVFAAADGLEIHGQLFRPASGAGAQRRPAVLFFHGGSRRQMLLGWHYMGYYHDAYALNQHLASRGFVVLSVNYRSGTGYGLEFREALGYGATGASEFADVLGAGLYLRGRDDVDPDRIGLWGGSYGGYLTALGLARASDLFAAGVDVHGVHDWNPVIRGFRPDYDPLRFPEQARLARESSPMADLERWRSPVLLIHGDDDRNVPFSESVDLLRELRARGVETEQLVLPDEVHGFLRRSSWQRVLGAAAEFLERRLAAPPR